MSTLDLLTRVKVKALIIGDPDIGTQEVSVDVVGGVVILSGEVETDKQKQVAEKLARQVPSVAAIRNELQVIGQEEEAEELVEG